MICALCQTEVGGEITKEHVFPQWMRKLFPTDDPRITYRRGVQGRGEPFTPQEWEDAPFNLRVKDLCKVCNNEWCSQIEAEAEPILRPMILGKSARLDASEQTTLAVWGYEDDSDAPARLSGRHARHPARYLRLVSQSSLASRK